MTEPVVDVLSKDGRSYRPLRTVAVISRVSPSMIWDMLYKSFLPSRCALPIFVLCVQCYDIPHRWILRELWIAYLDLGSTR